MKKEELTVVGLTNPEITCLVQSMIDDRAGHVLTQELIAKLRCAAPPGRTSRYYLKLK